MNRPLITSMKTLLAVLLPLFLAITLNGCATMPEQLREGPRQSPDPNQVRAAPDKYAGTPVRWGGLIVSVENEADQSVVEVVARPLASDARPILTDQNFGRFLVKFNGFIDPVDYAEGRELTVVGVLEGVEKRTIGDYHYAFPVVRASNHFLWPQRPPVVYDPYYYGPYYDPWYPYSPYYSYYPYYYPYVYPYPVPVPNTRPRPTQHPRSREIPPSYPAPRQRPIPEAPAPNPRRERR